MMRTPQDLLQELRMIFDSATLQTAPHPPGVELAGWLLPSGSMSRAFRALDALDKAIAEAPDSPHTYRMPDGRLHCRCVLKREQETYRAGRLAGFQEGIEAPDTLSDSALRAEAASFGVTLPPAPDTLSEKPGLDVERLRRSLEWAMRYVDPKAVTLTNQPDDPFTTGYIEAINALGSTDSEGR